MRQIMGSAISESSLRFIYFKDDSTRRPPGQRFLWRYMDFAKFVSMLIHGGLYFSVLAALDDELEGMPLKISTEATEYEKLALQAQYQQLRSATFVNCWYMSKHESTAMWTLYGDHGLAIQTTYDRLIRSINKSSSSCHREIRDGIVEYVDPNRTSTPSNEWNITTAALRKRRWYQHEREFRLIHFDEARGNGPFDPNGPSKQPPKRGLWVYCSLNEMISAIVLPPRSPRYLEECVASVCGKYGINPRTVMRSKIEGGSAISSVGSEALD
jgi:hypothetical protein